MSQRETTKWKLEKRDREDPKKPKATELTGRDQKIDCNNSNNKERDCFLDCFFLE